MILNSPYVSGSLTVTGNIIASGSITLSGSVASASYAASASNAFAAQTASYVLTAQTASFVALAQSASNAVSAQTASFVALAQSASNAVSAQTASFANAFTVAGTLTAQTLVVQTITSSVDFVTGSTRFGSLLDNTHVFSGSVTMNPGGLFVSSSGFVGIGTSNPDSRLTIRGTNSISMLYLGISGSSSNGEAVGITFGSATYDKARIVAYNENSGNAAGYLTLWTGGSPTTTDVTERMRITSAGNVGIGTTGPNTRLQILGSTLDVGNQSTYALGIGNGSGYDLTLGTSASYAYIQSWTGKPLNINSQGNNVLFPNASTNIGIGTTNPIVKVDVVGNSTDSVKLRVRNTNVSGSAGITLNPEGAGAGSLGDATIFYDVNSTAWVEGVDKSDSSKFKISNDVYGDFRSNTFFTIRTNGNVGIGTTNPLKTFEVNGRMSTSATVGGNLIAGNIASNMSTSPSYIPLFNLSEAAGFSLVGYVNAASYTCFNISEIYIRKEYSGSTINAGIRGLYKNACDFSIVNITYNSIPYVALRFTSNPEIDVMWTGYLLSYAFNSDGSAQVWTSGVTLNSTYASY